MDGRLCSLTIGHNDSKKILVSKKGIRLKCIIFLLLASIELIGISIIMIILYLDTGLDILQRVTQNNGNDL